MNKLLRVASVSVILIGVGAIIYGSSMDPSLDEPAIRKKYSCDRITLELRSTDKYCSDPASAPEADHSSGIIIVMAGIMTAVVGSGLFVTSILTKK